MQLHQNNMHRWGPAGTSPDLCCCRRADAPHLPCYGRHLAEHVLDRQNVSTCLRRWPGALICIPTLYLSWAADLAGSLLVCPAGQACNVQNISAVVTELNQINKAAFLVLAAGAVREPGGGAAAVLLQPAADVLPAAPRLHLRHQVRACPLVKFVDKRSVRMNGLQMPARSASLLGT